MSQETNQETAEQLTPEQLKKRRDDLITYYKNQTAVLEAQFKYESVMADIEEQRVKRMTMIMRQAQMAAPQQDEEEEEELSNETPTPTPEPEVTQPKERKLKTS
jgi:hypothetical protein